MFFACFSLLACIQETPKIVSATSQGQMVLNAEVQLECIVENCQTAPFIRVRLVKHTTLISFVKYLYAHNFKKNFLKIKFEKIKFEKNLKIFFFKNWKKILKNFLKKTWKKTWKNFKTIFKKFSKN